MCEFQMCKFLMCKCADFRCADCKYTDIIKSLFHLLICNLHFLLLPHLYIRSVSTKKAFPLLTEWLHIFDRLNRLLFSGYRILNKIVSYDLGFE